MYTTPKIKNTWILTTVFIWICIATSANSLTDKNFEAQYLKEKELVKKTQTDYNANILSLSAKNQQTRTLTLEQTLSYALKYNQAIQEAVLYYKQALLTYQKNLFSFQSNFGALNFDYRNTYGDSGGDVSIGNKIEKKFVNGLQIDLTNILANNINTNTYQLNENANITLHKQIYGWDKMHNLDTLQTAKESLASAKLTLRDTLSNQITDISANFRSVLYDEESLAATQSALIASKKNITKSKQLYKLGFLSQNDLNSIELQEINTQLNIESQMLRLRETLNRLKLKIGLSSQDSVKLLPDLSKQVKTDTLLHEMLSHRPRVEHKHLCDTLKYHRILINTRFNIDALQRQLAIHHRRKNVTINTSAGLTYSENKNQSSKTHSNISVTLPLDNKSKNNTIQNTRLQLLHTQQQFIQSCHELIREENDQFQNMIHHYNTAILAAKKLTISNTINQTSKIKFKYGTISATDMQQNHQLYLDAINQLRHAENQYTNAVEYYHKINNTYLNKLPINLPYDINQIFQTTHQTSKDRTIITAKFAFDCTNIHKKSPKEICHQLMYAPISIN